MNTMNTMVHYNSKTIKSFTISKRGKDKVGSYDTDMHRWKGKGNVVIGVRDYKRETKEHEKEEGDLVFRVFLPPNRENKEQQS